MKEILDFYQQQAAMNASRVPWLAQLQSKALADLTRYGFPRRQDEEWRYSSVDPLLKQPFNLVDQELPSGVPDASDLPLGSQIMIRNGLISGERELARTLPAGVLAIPLTSALANYPELVKPYLGTILKQEHGFHFLNTAMIHCGMLIYIPAGLRIEEPILLSHVQDRPNQAVYLRHVILAEAGSQAHILEEYQGLKDTCYLTNTVTEIFVGSEAKLTHYKIQRESKEAYHLGHISVSQDTHSEFASHSLSLGGKWVRSDLSVYLKGEKAHCLMNGIYAPTAGQHVDQHTQVEHLVPHCSSEQDYKGILTGCSRAVFNGKVFVAPGAQHTDAKQQNKNLLLSTDAEVDTKPQLDIFADDVLCSHGATVGQLDEEALFYLATRGIDPSQAFHYLIHAFAEDNLRLIPSSKLAEVMGQLLIQQLGQVHEFN
jgi:Fe-S cluster assembly protein SufD